MLSFTVDRVEEFSNAISLLLSLRVNKVDFNGTPTMFSIIISKSYPSPFLVSLQIMSQFFSSYSCDQIQYVNLNIVKFHAMILEHKPMDCFSSSFDFSLRGIQYVCLKFRNPDQTVSIEIKKMARVPAQQTNVYNIDYSSFVSFELEEFKRILRVADETCVHQALITLTQSQVTFSLPGGISIVLSNQRNQECIIGGIGEEEQIQSPLLVVPMQFFNNLTSRRIWLFKSIDSNHLILTAPTGLYLQYLSYICSQTE